MLEHGKPDAAVIFDGGGPGSRDMRRRVEAAGLPLRVVDVRGLVGGR
jgi:hypothetical protein